MPIPFEILQITAAYSNAVLVAIMPYVSDYAKKLELPIRQPVSIAQVRHFGCSPRADHIGGRVILTNGYSFTFDSGMVALYSSPRSFFSLQEPERMPEFYGPIKIKADDAVKVARGALRKLGYTESELHFDLPPNIKPPLKSGSQRVARYLIEWRDPTQPDPGKFGIYRYTARVEVDASAGQVRMLSILTPNRRPNPRIDVHPPVLVPPPRSQLLGGTKVYPVSRPYADAFLIAILPQLTDFVRRAGLGVRIPITTNDVDVRHYDCGVVEGLPRACIYLRVGDRFWYEHGQVISYESPDAYRWPAPNSPPEDKPKEQFYGPINLSAEEALAVVRKAVNQLGWPAQVPQLRQKPDIVPPRKDGTNYFARYFCNWWLKGQGTQCAVAELDASTKKLKALYINDRANPSLWREPPKVGVPMDVKIPDHEEPSFPPSRFPAPIPTLPSPNPLGTR